LILAAVLAVAANITLPTPSAANFVMIAKNGRLAAAICGDHKIRVWVLPDGQLLQTVDVNGRHGSLSALSDDGRSMMIADYAGVVTVWDTSTGETRLEQRFDHYPLAAAFSHDGDLLALATGSGPVQVFDLAAKRLAFKLPDTPAGSVAIAFSRDGALIGTADGDGVVRIHDARTGKLIYENSDFLMEPLTLDFTPDHKHVVAAGADKSVVFIDTATGKTVRRTKKMREAVVYLEVSPDGQQLAVVTLNANNMQLPAPLVVLDTASLETKKNWMPKTGLIGGAWMPDGHFLVATSSSEAVHLRRLR
jgi:WD40 repeat protein